MAAMLDIFRNYRTTIIALLLALAILLAASLALSSKERSASVELGAASLSPRGAEGGAVIPASCGSPHSGDLCEPPSVSCDPTSVNQGGSSTCTWSCPSGETSAGIGFSTGGANSGSVQFNPPATGNYGAQCSGGGQSTVTITAYSPALSLTATPGRVRSGSATTLQWSATNVNANSCSIKDQDNNTVASGNAGSTSRTISQETVFTLTCVTDAGPVSVSVTVGILPSIEPF